ncbi:MULTISPECIES: VOC family protein [unclassified Acinetobacter]|uniref:VOC family protein n=1 Tax=unclassified Acinetobacter TaxID=196816 RepID=UPI00190B0D34|nr:MULTISPECIES: VOC family protein [unclassified Acinetobacter]MBK0062918.1 VOC family protein [Acinetobacter sp. S55]MBK0066664.1 VOC family protein [Acinetobacter sp. S54]
MNNAIYPCIWLKSNRLEAAEFYCSLFNGQISQNNEYVSELYIFKQRLMLLSGGPNIEFKINPSISFMLLCGSIDQVQYYWDQIITGGCALMPLDRYPWSPFYGWVQDKFGVSWQLYLDPREDFTSQRLIPTLMFTENNAGKALNAMQFYTHIFPNSEITSLLYYKESEKGSENSDYIQHAQFTIDDFILYAMDSSYSHHFGFNQGISLVVETSSQMETDHLWTSLLQHGGIPMQCSWLKDQFGIHWQIVPKRLIELINHANPNIAQLAMNAMFHMQKINIQEIEDAIKP